MSKHKLVPAEPTQEMIDAGCKKHTCNYGDFCLESEIEDQDVKSIYVAMLSAAPEVEQEPYAYEYGVSNGDGTFSVVMNKGRLTKLGENEYGYCHPGIFASKEWPVTPLYLHPQQTQETSRNESFAFRADGEANFYTVSERGGNWTARIQFNGEFMCDEQERMTAVITDALAAYRTQDDEIPMHPCVMQLDKVGDV